MVINLSTAHASVFSQSHAFNCKDEKKKKNEKVLRGGNFQTLMQEDSFCK